MKFNTDLYWSLAVVFPDITVRSLSEMMGKSAGYWSNVSAQKYAVGTVHSSSFWTLWSVKKCKLLRELLTPKARSIECDDHPRINHTL